MRQMSAENPRENFGRVFETLAHFEFLEGDWENQMAALHTLICKESGTEYTSTLGIIFVHI